MALRPLITICGTTGVGKSKLAIELALKLSNSTSNHGWRGARIINADSMQVYAGMDVITNKVPETEMQGIDHLLMGFKKPGEQYFVGQWVMEAIKAIDETHSKNQIPIVVGGTSYWIQHLMFPDRLAPSESTSKQSLSTAVSANLAQSLSELTPRLLDSYNSLPDYAEPASINPEAAVQLHALLSALDPTIAVRWHWKDTRKVLRSLHIMRNTGRKPSEIINEQSQNCVRPRYRALCFWLYAEPLVLHQRLNARVDEMIEQGLLNEILALREIASSQSSTSALVQRESLAPDFENLTTDYTTGIYQSIGYKEFHNYLASPQRSDRTFSDAVENMKQSTRQYAKRQVSWIRNKLLPAVYAANASSGEEIEPVTPVYLLDATELGDKWNTSVRDLGQKITEAFLAKQVLPDPKSLSDAARAMLTISDKPTDPIAVLNARRRTICLVCTTDNEQPVMIEEGKEWGLHQKSRTHRKLVSRAIRQKLGQQRHAITEGTEGQPTVVKDAWQDMDESVMTIFLS